MMRQDRFTLTPALSLRERVQGAPPSVILSGDHVRTGPQRCSRRNLGRGEPSVSRDAAGDLKVAPTPASICMR